MTHINKVAILIDAGFYRKRHQHFNNQKFPQKEDIQLFTNSILNKVQQKGPNTIENVLFRIFWYDCKPYEKTQKDPDSNLWDFRKKTVYSQSLRLLQELKTADQVALRLGELSFEGWRLEKMEDGTLRYHHIFQQKSVDMKNGLDIAWMASKRVVDKLVLVTADSDFISPMKFARREGLLVYLESMGANTKEGLREHADYLL